MKSSHDEGKRSPQPAARLRWYKAPSISEACTCIVEDRSTPTIPGIPGVPGVPDGDSTRQHRDGLDDSECTMPSSTYLVTETELDDVHHVRGAGVHQVGERQVAFLDVESHDGTWQRISLEGHFDWRFIPAPDCISCGAPINADSPSSGSWLDHPGKDNPQVAFHTAPVPSTSVDFTALAETRNEQVAFHTAPVPSTSALKGTAIRPQVWADPGNNTHEHTSNPEEVTIQPGLRPGIHPAILCSSCRARDFQHLVCQECEACEAHRSHLYWSWLSSNATRNDSFQDVDVDAVDVIRQLVARSPTGDTCPMIEKTRSRRDGWPRCLDDHVIVLSFHCDPPCITWSILPGALTSTMVPLLGGWFRIILGYQETIMDLRDALILVGAIARGIRDGNTCTGERTGMNTGERTGMNTGERTGAATFSTKHALSGIDFRPEWDFTIQEHFKDMDGLAVQTRRDGGLWIAGLESLKSFLENENEHPNENIEPRSRIEPDSLPIGRSFGAIMRNSITCFTRPIAMMLEMLEKAVRSIIEASTVVPNGIARIDLSDLAILSIDLPSIDIAMFPNVVRDIGEFNDVKPDSFDESLENHITLHGTIMARHGSILVTTLAGKQRAIDIRSVIGLKPVLHRANIPPGILHVETAPGLCEH